MTSLVPGDTTKRSRRRLSLEEKTLLHSELRNGNSIAQVQNHVGCSRRTVFDIQKNAASILEQAAHRGSGMTKTVKPSQFPEIDQHLFQWVQMARSARLPVSSASLSAKAHHIRELLLSQNNSPQQKEALIQFSASSTWVGRFTARHALRSVRLHGKAGSVTISDVSQGIAQFCENLSTYDVDNIYNQDETGLFFKLFPKQSYVLESEGGKTLRGITGMGAKDRVTLFVCTNATGTRKLPMVMIGKAKRPRWFSLSPPAVPYMSQRNAWADTITFKHWFTSCFIPFIRRHTSDKVALVMDNCGSHNADLWDTYDLIAMFTLLPNCTSVYQPMDMGVIAAFKLRYRRILLGNISNVLEERTSFRQAGKKRKPA